MAKETLAALLDTAPVELIPSLEEAIRNVPGVLEQRRMRVRQVGNKLFVESVIAVDRNLPFNQTHVITEGVEQAVRQLVPDADVVVHTEPVVSATESAADQIRFIARQQGVRVHDVHVHYVNTQQGQMDADVHVELDPSLSLAEAHALASRLEESVLAANQRLASVHTHLEAPPIATEIRQDVTGQHPELVAQVRATADSITQPGATGHVSVYQIPAVIPEYDLVLEVRFPGDLLLPRVHERVEAIERALRAQIPHLGSVLIHAEPPDSGLTARRG
jgi:divalent metal cation (Fe/Co/Zn/Cd) transporter